MKRAHTPPMTRESFEGYDEPVKIDLEPEEGLRALLQIEPQDSGESD